MDILLMSVKMRLLISIDLHVLCSSKKSIFNTNQMMKNLQKQLKPLMAIGNVHYVKDLNQMWYLPAQMKKNKNLNHNNKKNKKNQVHQVVVQVVIHQMNHHNLHLKKKDQNQEKRRSKRVKNRENDHNINIQLMSEDVEYDTYFCCFKVAKHKSKTQSEKMSMQQVGMNNSHYEASQQYFEETEKEQEVPIRKVAVQPLMQIKNSMIESGLRLDYPKNKIFLLKNKQFKESILAKITEKWFSPNELTQSLTRDELSPRSELSDQSSTPDLLAKYIARRISKKVQIVTDFGCGGGSNTVQFAKECGYVIAVDIEDFCCRHTEQLCMSQKVQVDIVHADLFMLKKLKSDLIFINPTTQVIDGVHDLISGCSPNLKEIFQNHFQSPNFIIQAPGCIDLTQLPLLISIGEQYQAIEIEQVYINKVLEYHVIYIGEAANIGETQIYKYLAKQLNQVQKIPQNKTQLMWLIDQIKCVIGKFALIKLVLESVRQKHQIEQFCALVQSRCHVDEDLYFNYKKRPISEDIISQTSMKQDSLFQLSKMENNEDNLQSPVYYSLEEQQQFQPSMPNYFDELDDKELEQNDDEDQNHQWKLTIENHLT